MKNFIKILAAILVLVLVGFYFVTKPLVNRAEDFLIAVNDNNLTKTESFLTDKFKKNTPKTKLANYLITYGIYGYKDIDFSFFGRKVSFGNDMGEVKGTITSKNGEEAPIRFSLKKEKGVWKISGIEKVLGKAEKEKIYKEKKAIIAYTKLSQLTIHMLGLSTKDNNFKILHDYISKKWQKEVTVEALQKTYGVFYKNKINLIALDKVVPKLTYINIDKNGILTIKGYYNVGKNKVYFLQSYIVEDKKWKLVALSVEIR